MQILAELPAFMVQRGQYSISNPKFTWSARVSSIEHEMNKQDVHLIRCSKIIRLHCWKAIGLSQPTENSVLISPGAFYFCVRRSKKKHTACSPLPSSDYLARSSVEKSDTLLSSVRTARLMIGHRLAKGRHIYWATTWIFVSVQNAKMWPWLTPI